MKTRIAVATNGSFKVRFQLLDRIESATEQRLEAVKVVSRAEEYLADHFPTFPVLPGVLMLEAAVQAATWLALSRAGFAFSVAVLREARNVRYGQFVAPGQALRITAIYEKATARGHSFGIEGLVETGSSRATAITGRVELSCFRLSERGATDELDLRLIATHRARWAELTLLRPELALAATGGASRLCRPTLGAC